MNSRMFGRVAITVLAIAALVLVGTYTYNLGVAHGVAEAGRVVAAPGGVPVVAVWPRPWGFGFGFFPFFPLLFILFWFVVARGLFWRGGWRGCGYRYYDGIPPAFEEWHRRAHGEPRPPAPPQSV